VSPEGVGVGGGGIDYSQPFLPFNSFTPNEINRIIIIIDFNTSEHD
jgi:hypothetical protein